MLYEFLKAEFTSGLLSKAAALVAYPVLMRFKRRIDPRRLNGATLLGLKGVVVKSHGSADRLGFCYAIERAAEEVRGEVLERIGARLAAAEGAAPLAEAAS
jgi:glycerol-3-phosphate acyltransferase PlsX